MESPFAGWPQTIALRDATGIREIHVDIQALTPFRVKVANFLALVTIVGIVIGSLWVLDVPTEHGAAVIGTAVIGGGIGWAICRALWRAALAKEVRCQFTPERFEVHSRWQTRVYDRTKDHRFRLQKHDWAEAEKRRHEAIVRKNPKRNPVPIYGDSYHVVFEYAGVRRDVMTVYERETADAIFERLNQCDAVMNKRVGHDSGTRLGPEDDWPDGPGDLP